MTTAGFAARSAYIVFACLAIVACRQGGPSVSPTEAPPPADAAAIRAVDFTQVTMLKTLIAQVGGFFDPRTALYADITGDGREEAILPLSSGGTLGNVAYQVYTLRGGVPALVLNSTRDQTTVGGLVMKVEDGQLVRTTGRYGSEDPRCCPSMLLKTSYHWDGKALQVEKEEEIRTAAGPKTKSE